MSELTTRQAVIGWRGVTCGAAEQAPVHEPRCNTNCQPGAHHLTDGIGYPHLHRTDLAQTCGECRPDVHGPGERT